MEIEYQNKKTDYLNFYKNYLVAGLRKRILTITVFPLFAALIGGQFSQPFSWIIATIAFFIAAIIMISIFYILPYLTAKARLNKLISTNAAYLEKQKISITEVGLIAQNGLGETTWNWKSINSCYMTDDYIYIELVNKKIFLIPTIFFKSENEAVNFLGIIQNGILKVRGTINKISPFDNIVGRPPYLLGLLCLIPLIGIFIGIALFILGIVKFKDKWFTIIGVLGIIIGAAIYPLLAYYIRNGDFPQSSFQYSFVAVSQNQLNDLVKDIEFYKIENGQYPDSLQQLLLQDKSAPVYDPLQAPQLYNYKRIGSKYLLFSSGQDGIPNTKDDIYPSLPLKDSSKIGYIIPKRYVP